MNERKVIVIDAKPVITNNIFEANKRKKRVCAYARVSTNTLDQINSYNAQIDEYTKRIKNNPDWEFKGLYADEGLSGTSYKNRTEFNKMINDARKNLIDLILVKSVSRFSRNTVDALSIIRELRSLGVEVFFEKENMSSLDSKVDFHLTIFSSIAQEESRNISENVKWGIRKRYEEGKVKINTKRFLGYDKDDKGKLIINPSEATTVQDIFTYYILGYSYKEIGERLEVEGRLNGAGISAFSPASIMRILKNEKYMGDVLLQKTVTVDYLTHKAIKNSGHAPQYYIKNNHPPIINRELFENVQHMISIRHKENTNTRYARKYPLSGIVHCSDCGRVLNRNHYKLAGENKRVVLTCKNSYTNKKSCKMQPIDNEALELLCNKVLNKLGFFDESVVNNLINEFSSSLKDDELYKQIVIKETLIKEIEIEINNLIELRVSNKDNYNDEYLIKSYNTKKEAINQLNSEISLIKTDVANATTKKARLVHMRDVLNGENILFRDVLLEFTKKIIQISPTEVVFVMGDFELSKEEFEPLIPKLLNSPVLSAGEVYIESLDIKMKYQVTKYDEGMLVI